MNKISKLRIVDSEIHQKLLAQYHDVKLNPMGRLLNHDDVNIFYAVEIRNFELDLTELLNSR